MSTQKIAYGSYTSVTITLNPSGTGIGTNTARQSNAIDNSTDLADDFLVGGKFKTASGSLGTNAAIYVWVAALTDDGTVYAAGASGSDASYTMPSLSKGNLRLLCVVPLNAAATVEYMSPCSLAALFGGSCPKKFALIVENQSGLALDNSAPGTLTTQEITWTFA